MITDYRTLGKGTKQRPLKLKEWLRLKKTGTLWQFPFGALPRLHRKFGDGGSDFFKLFASLGFDNDTEEYKHWEADWPVLVERYGEISRDPKVQQQIIESLNLIK